MPSNTNAFVTNANNNGNSNNNGGGNGNKSKVWWEVKMIMSKIKEVIIDLA